MNKNVLFIDIETKSECDLKKTSAWVYSEHKTTDVLCVAYRKYKDKKVKLWVPGQKIPVCFSGDIIYVAHASQFEFSLFYNILIKKYNFPKRMQNTDNWLCTMNMARSAGLPGGLDRVASTLNLGLTKMDQGKILLRKFSIPVWKKQKDGTKIAVWLGTTKEELKRFYDYCMQDVRVLSRVYECLADNHNVQLEKDICRLDMKQNMQGLPIDIYSLTQIVNILDKTREKAEQMQNKYSVNVRSTPLLKKWMREKGIDLPNCQQLTVAKLLRTNKDKDIKKVLTLRIFLSRASVKKFDALKNNLSGDRFLRQFITYYGGHTGRFAGKGFQPHNLPKSNITGLEQEKILKNFLAGKVKFWDTMGEAKKLVPAMIRAEKGKTFILGDFAAIEARVLAYIAGEKILLKQFTEGLDPYKTMAARIFNKEVEKISKEERQVGKQAVLGCGFGMGAPRFRETCRINNIFISEELADTVVQTYRRQMAYTKKFWYDLERAVLLSVQQKTKIKFKNLILMCVGTTFYIELLSKRRMYYHNVSIDADGISFLNFRKNCRIHVYGGLLTENVCQAIARDILTDRMLELQQKKLHPILSVHDEIICYENEKGILKKQKTFDQIMNTSPGWMPEFPLKTESEITKRYHK